MKQSAHYLVVCADCGTKLPILSPRAQCACGGLLEVLEITVFSDEAGVPKPHPRIFAHTLEALGVAPDATVHVGDLRRTDVAGARAAGMGTVSARRPSTRAATWPNSATEVRWPSVK